MMGLVIVALPRAAPTNHKPRVLQTLSLDEHSQLLATTWTLKATSGLHDNSERGPVIKSSPRNQIGYVPTPNQPIETFWAPFGVRFDFRLTSTATTSSPAQS